MYKRSQTNVHFAELFNNPINDTSSLAFCFLFGYIVTLIEMTAQFNTWHCNVALIFYMCSVCFSFFLCRFLFFLFLFLSLFTLMHEHFFEANEALNILQLLETCLMLPTKFWNTSQTKWINCGPRHEKGKKEEKKKKNVEPNRWTREWNCFTCNYRSIRTIPAACWNSIYSQKCWTNLYIGF